MGSIEKAMSEDIDSIMNVTDKIKWILVCDTEPSVFSWLIGRLVSAPGILEDQYTYFIIDNFVEQLKITQHKPLLNWN